jgi:hypothetical protein
MAKKMNIDELLGKKKVGNVKGKIKTQSAYEKEEKTRKWIEEELQAGRLVPDEAIKALQNALCFGDSRAVELVTRWRTKGE